MQKLEKKIFHVNGNPKQARPAILIKENTYYDTKAASLLNSAIIHIIFINTQNVLKDKPCIRPKPSLHKFLKTEIGLCVFLTTED